MRVLILISFMTCQAMGFLLTRKSTSGAQFKFAVANGNGKFMRNMNLRLQSDPNETPSWQIEGGDTSETECSSSGDIARAAAAAVAKAEADRLQAEAAAKSRSEDEQKSIALAAEAALKAEAAKQVVVPAPVAAAIIPAVSATVSAPKTDLTKLSVGTDSFDVGLLIAFPIIVATLGFFFLFPLIGPQLAQTLPPVPKM